MPECELLIMPWPRFCHSSAVRQTRFTMCEPLSASSTRQIFFSFLGASAGALTGGATAACGAVAAWAETSINAATNINHLSQKFECVENRSILVNPGAVPGQRAHGSRLLWL